MTTGASTKSRQRDSQATTEEFLSGKLAQVDIKRIESELKSLWESAARSDKERAQGPVTRVCVMNLIMYTDHREAEKSATDLLGDIILRHPCRAILAICRESAPRALEAWVSARCHRTDEKTQKQICCEQITVRGESVSTKELASAVMPMILADLPVFMWWNAEEFSFDKAKPFLSSVDRFIVDSGIDSGALQFFCDLLKIMNESNARSGEPAVSCSDLNWRRSAPWREAVALAFEKRQGQLSPEYLPGISSLDIRYGYANDAASPVGLTNQALLIIGWLASALGWRPQSAKVGEKGRVELAFDARGNKVAVNLIAVATDEAAVGDIGSIQIHSNKPEDVTIVASQQPGNPGIGVTCLRGISSQKAQGATLFELDEAPERQLIDKELENLGDEPVFKRSVASTVEILTLLTKDGGNSQRR
ncbi:MAG TPA: glucose-6-phosphate dehydrogenase assembly protein OpcA [Planktothrix sp.]|jgi:glucose-6-phosphate dehydrogenase assembly protein OpcA